MSNPGQKPLGGMKQHGKANIPVLPATTIVGNQAFCTSRCYHGSWMVSLLQPLRHEATHLPHVASLKFFFVPLKPAEGEKAKQFMGKGNSLGLKKSRGQPLYPYALPLHRFAVFWQL